MMSVRRSHDPKAIEAWNERFRSQVSPELFERLRMAQGSESILFGVPPDTDRIAMMIRLLHGLASRTDVVGATMRDLHDGGLGRWHVQRDLPVDTVPVWGAEVKRGMTAPLQIYSAGLLEHLHAQGVGE